MSLPSAIGFLIFLIVVIVPCVIIYMLCWGRPYNIIRKKGYTPRQAYLFAGWWQILGVLTLLASYRANENLVKRYFVPYFLLLAIGTLFCYMIEARYLKQASVRKFGKRVSRTDWKFWAGFLKIIGIATGILILGFSIWIYYKSGTKNALSILTKIINIYVGIAGIIALINFYRNQFSKADIEKSTTADPRAPVLWIRSFAMDNDIFYGGLLKSEWAKSQLSTDLFLHQQYSGYFHLLTFQQYFSKAFKVNLGPLIGLGNPTDYIPPEGLVTSYYEDRNWQEMFQTWIQEAACIICLPGKTAGLQFELNYILEHNLADRFFIFTKPGKISASGRLALRFFQWLRASESVPWPGFAANMAALGYVVQPEEPPPGTVIGFDRQGKQKTVLTDAQSPFEYAVAVYESLHSK